MDKDEIMRGSNDAALDRLIERVGQETRNLQTTLILAHEFVSSDEFKQDVAPYFNDLSCEITFLVDLAEHKDIILPRLAEDLQALYGEEKISLKEFFERENEDGMTPYEAILRKRSGMVADERDSPSHILKELAAERGIAPKKYVMPNNKLANTLGELVRIGEPRDLIVGSYGKGPRKQIVTSFAMAEFVSGDGVKFEGDYGSDDRVINNAMISLWYQSPEAPFTALHVFRAIPGNQDKTPTAKRLEDIENKIEKQRFLMVAVDATEELFRYKLIDEHGRDKNGNKVRVKFREPVVMLKEATFEATNQHGTKERKVYRFASNPILNYYACLTGQIITAPASRLAIKEVTTKGNVTDKLLSNTPERNVLIQHYYRRIAVMKNDLEKAKKARRQYEARRKKDLTLPDKPLSSFCEESHRILFEKAFAATELDTEKGKPIKRDKLKAYRDFVFQCLEYWKAIKWIKGYRIVQSGQGGKVRAVDIILE